MQDGTMPYYLEHLVDCVNRMLYYRDVSSYVAHNRANSGVSTLDKGNNRIIEGNIGCLIFTSGDISYGVEWVAASFNLKTYLKEVLESEGSYVLIEPQGKCIHSHINVCGEDLSFPPMFRASHNDRTHDSEYLLLNFLGYLIVQGTLPASGRLSLITERIPCESCTAVLCSFAKQFTGITLDVFYMHDTQDRQPGAFLKSIAEHDIRLIKVAFHTVVNAVEISENPRITVGSAAREQGKMFGGAPNQILQAIRPSS